MLISVTESAIFERCFIYEIYLHNINNYNDLVGFIERERLILSTVCDGIKLSKFCIIHDEGDVVTKDHDIKNVQETQSESHKEWLSLINYFNTYLKKKHLIHL